MTDPLGRDCFHVKELIDYSMPGCKYNVNIRKNDVFLKFIYTLSERCSVHRELVGEEHHQVQKGIALYSITNQQ